MKPATSALFVAALLCALASSSARADEVDLTDSGRAGAPERPATFVIYGGGGSNFSPFGLAGGAINYFNDSVDGEVELGAGAGFPGVQGGLSLRKLFGGPNDFLLVELGLIYNNRVARGVDPLVIGTGSHTWSNLGVGYEHRLRYFALGISGGISLFGFNQGPSAYLRACIGLGIW